MTTPNGSLPDYLLIYSQNTGDASEYPQGCWYITDRHGNRLFNNVLIRLGTMLEMLADAGANYQVVDPRKHIVEVERTPNVIPPPNRNNHQ